MDTGAACVYVMFHNMATAGGVKDKVMVYHMGQAHQPGPRDRGRYHHGDLRRDLVRVARAEIAQHGADTVSLTSLARLAGVSQPAPYRHFADRTALLEAVAAEGFSEFTTSLADSVNKSELKDAVKAIEIAYLAFAENNIELYRLMFASRLTPQAEVGSELDEAAGKAFAILKEALLAVPPHTATERDAYLIWAQLHGLVMLKADGFIQSALVGFVEW